MLRAGAGVVTFDDRQHPIELRKSSNGMICARFVPGEDAWDARCYQESFTPLFFRSRELIANGMKRPEVDARMDAEIKAGTLKLPERPTSGYRILGPVDAYDPKTGHASPVMRFWQSIHMPYRTAGELGLLNDSDVPRGHQSTLPFVMSGGTWWSHVMITHDPATSAGRGVRD